MAIGTPASETLSGADAPDTLIGAEGNDTLRGLGGNDSLLGDSPGAGFDSIEGGEGDDFLSGQDGGDTLLGGNGNDTGFGGAGNDSLLGGAGPDSLMGDAGADVIAGEGGDDLVRAGDGNDSVDGGEGDDLLWGEAGADSLSGGNGDDGLYADAGDVFVDGGAGAGDVLIVTANAVGLIDIRLGNAANQNASGAGPVLQGFEGVDASRAIVGLAITGAALNGLGNVLLGGNFNDTLTGSPLADHLWGGDGRDSLDGGGGDDTLWAGNGNDSIDGGLGNDVLFLPGNAATYQIANAGGVFTITGPGGVFSVRNVQSARFGDQTVPLSPTDSGTNLPPTALNDAATVSENGPTTIAGASLRANDSDPDPGDVLTIVSVAGGGAAGTVSLSGADVVFTPSAAMQALPQGGSALGSFTYTIQDIAGAPAIATVAVTVSGVNDAPTAGNDTASAAENGITFINIPGVLANDSDVDTGDTLSIFGADTVSAHGAFVLNTGAAFSFNPSGAFDSLGGGQTLADSFTYTVRDVVGATATATVFVTVTGANDAPVAGNDTVNGSDNATLNIPWATLFANDSDIDATDTKSIVAVTVAESGAAVTISGNTVVYNPGFHFQFLNQGQTVNDRFFYTLRDSGGAESTARVTVVVAGSGTDGGGGLRGGSESGGDGGSPGDGDGGDSGEGSGDGPQYNEFGQTNRATTPADLPNLSGTNGSNNIPGTSLNDAFRGRGGADTLNGAAGVNMAIYDTSPAAVVVNLGQGTAQDGFGATDTLVNIQRVLGSTFDDTLIGSSAPYEFFHGFKGSDLINAGGGFDVFSAYDDFPNGGGPNTEDSGTPLDLSEGFDRDDLEGTFNGQSIVVLGVIIDLDERLAFDPWGGIDTINGIEGVIGSTSDDLLLGSDASFERFAGSEGEDSIDGRGGIDEVDYRFVGKFDNPDPDREKGVNVNLATGITSDDGEDFDDPGDVDLLLNVEWVRGSGFRDTITGSSGPNRLTGLGSNDLLVGGAGNDTLIGDALADFDLALASDSRFDQPGRGADTMTGGTGVDRFVFTSALDISNSFVTKETITDFVSGTDLLDFSNSDLPDLGFAGNFANLGAITSNPQFGQQLLYFSTSDKRLYLFTNADTTPDGVIVLTGVNTLQPKDFVFHA